VAVSIESALALAFAWALAVVFAIVTTQWQPRHTHPLAARCRCVECVVRRARRIGG
jgi:hypothetical protein